MSKNEDFDDDDEPLDDEKDEGNGEGDDYEPEDDY